jgi:hypothetical protein
MPQDVSPKHPASPAVMNLLRLLDRRPEEFEALKRA